MNFFRVARYVLCLIIPLTFSITAYAEVVLDGTLGTKGSVTGPNFNITSTMGQTYGGNLFHSFNTFNLNNTESAIFTGPSTITNIICRVTGGQASSIDGTIKSNIAGADFWFINPSGIVFGQNAKLDVSGSFHASTADYIKLSDNSRFDASNPANPILTSAPPSAFGFLSSNPQSISLNGSFLKVSEGKTLSLVGGNLDIQNSNLYASGGTINLVSVASAGEAVVDKQNFKIDSFSKFGDINIKDTRTDSEKPVYDFNPNNTMGNIDVSGEGGGKVFIVGGRFVIDNGQVHADTYGDRDGAGISILIDGDLNVTNSAMITSETNGKGNAGQIIIETGSLSITGGGWISTSALEGSEGNGGDITIRAKDSIDISGYYDSGSYVNSSSILSETYGKGSTGKIVIETGSLNITGSGKISTNAWGTSEGNGGDITVRAADSIVISGYYNRGTHVYNSGIFSETEGKGSTGDITIETGKLSLAGAGRISTSAQEGTKGKAGSITIKADDSVTISGFYDSGDVFYSSGVFSETFGSGKAGDITIETGRLNISNAGWISTSAWTGSEGDGGNITVRAKDSVTISGYYDRGPTVRTSGIFSETDGKGKAGDITIKTGDLSLTNAGMISTGVGENGEGDGGSIKIRADNSIAISGYYYSHNIINSSGIFSDTGGKGKAGDIMIETGSLSITDVGWISTSSWAGGGGDGGSITISAKDITISGYYDSGHIVYSSSIYSETGGEGNGGMINVNSETLNLYDKARISAESFGTGEAGSITINASDTVRLQGSAISTAADSAGGGHINLFAGRMINLINSETTATVAGGTSNGGNINATAPFFILNDSKVTAQADEGKGGNINLKTDTYIRSAGSIVSASSKLGIDGTVVTSSPAIDLSGKVVLVQAAYIDTVALTPKQCVEREEELSSFTVKGRDGLPPFPDSLLAIP